MVNELKFVIHAKNDIRVPPGPSTLNPGPKTYSRTTFKTQEKSNMKVRIGWQSCWQWFEVAP